MGLLDDAIREHLELKRKHGAGDDELRRQEVEALGPARRDFTAEAAPVADQAEGAPSDAAPSDTVEPLPEPAGWLEDEPGETPFEPAAEAPAGPVAEPAKPVVEPDEPALEAAPEADEPPAQERRESDTPTEGFPALTRDEEPPPEGEEDVLEETPDFLQDTPEHDRLWFEQKPPRDFDFDG